MEEKVRKIIPFLPIFLILLVAAYLRLYRIADYMTFLGDEGRDVLVVKRMIVDHKWTLLGPTASVGGFFMGPVYYYFMLPFLWAWKLNPMGPAVMVALFGIATVYLVYLVGRRWFSKSTGLLAASLYALSPIVIAFSRSSWNPNIVPFFALVSTYLLWKAIVERKTYLLFWVGLCAGIGVQLHYSYLFLIVAQAVYIAVFFRSFKRIERLLCFLWFAGFIFGFLPFLAFELRHEFTNTRSILQFVFMGKDTGFNVNLFFFNIQDVFLRLFGRFILRIPESGALGNLPVIARECWKTGQMLLAFSGIGALTAYGIQAVKKENTASKHTVLLFVLWFSIPLLFFGVYKKNIYDYYFGIMYPLPFFLTALVVENISRLKKIGFWVSITVAAVLLVWNWQGRPFRYEPNRQLAQVELISRTVVEKAGNQPFNFALVTTGNSDHAYRYFFELWDRKPVIIENSDVDPGRNSVTEQLMIVCEDIFCQPLGNSLWEVAGFGRAEIAGAWDVSVVKIYRLVHYQGL